MSPASSFPPTEWSQLEALRDPKHAEYRPALERIAALYRCPIFRYYRAGGATVEQAEDWTQEFFLRCVLGEHNKLAEADQTKGRFRNFLRTLLRHFAADQGPARTTRQHAFEQVTLSLNFVLSDEERSWQPADASPDEEFDRRWAAEVVDLALKQLHELAPEDWPIFAAYYLEDAPPSQEALAAQFGVSRDQVRKVLKRAKDRLERLLRAEFRADGASETEMDAEIADLLCTLAAGGDF